MERKDKSGRVTENNNVKEGMNEDGHLFFSVNSTSNILLFFKYVAAEIKYIRSFSGNECDNYLHQC